jgi:hypothetical protein
MNDIYIIQTQEEYDAILTRLSVIEERINKAGIKEINFNEIWKLVLSVQEWKMREYNKKCDELINKEKGDYGFMDD